MELGQTQLEAIKRYQNAKGRKELNLANGTTYYARMRKVLRDQRPYVVLWLSESTEHVEKREYERVLLQAAQEAHTSRGMSDAVQAVLRLIGEGLELLRLGVFEVQDSVIHNCYEWSAAELLSRKAERRAIPRAQWQQIHLGLAPSDSTDESNAFGEMAHLVASSEEQSGLSVPLIMAEEVRGYLLAEFPPNSKHLGKHTIKMLEETSRLLGHLMSGAVAAQASDVHTKEI